MLIQKFVFNIFARLALPSFQFNYRANDDLDKLFWVFSQNQLTNACYSMHTVSFSVLGLDVEAWNANRWYAWLSQGSVSQNGRVVYRWYNSRPSAYVMWVFRQHLRKSEAKKAHSKIDALLYRAAVQHEDET